MDQEFELVLCVVKNEKLHQALLNKEQLELLKAILPGITGNNPLRCRETPICSVAIEKKSSTISTEQCTDRPEAFADNENN